MPLTLITLTQRYYSTQEEGVSLPEKVNC